MDTKINKPKPKPFGSTSLKKVSKPKSFSVLGESNVYYRNLNFKESSESSSQAINEGFKSKLTSENVDTDNEKCIKKQPRKILPINNFFSGKSETQKKKVKEIRKEKSLLEMGFKLTEIQGWERIVQPRKENLYILLRKLIENHLKPNVQIRIGGTNFNCHMVVLQCYSEFFMGCNTEIIIQLPEDKITPRAFIMVYEWMLADEPLVQREGILELFSAALFLGIKSLVNQCWTCFDDDSLFREDTAFLLYVETRLFDMENLEQVMLPRICKFFLPLVASKEFLELTGKEICKLLRLNTIGVNSEMEIFWSAVRWLSHNWEEREEDMVNVVQCVRFGLMPPWFLVALNKTADYVDIKRIVSNPKVASLINEGISYTTTQLYYGENREQFLKFLGRCHLNAPIQRKWVFDKLCSYHHRLQCPNIQFVTYKSFLEYLDAIQAMGIDYWRSFEMAEGIENSMQCCVPADCRLSKSYPTMNYRDQGVQVEYSLRQRKTPNRDSRMNHECKHVLSSPIVQKSHNKASLNQKQIVRSVPSSCQDKMCRKSNECRNHQQQYSHELHTCEHIPLQQYPSCHHKHSKNGHPEVPCQSRCTLIKSASSESDQSSEVHHCVEGGCMSVSSVSKFGNYTCDNMMQRHSNYSKNPQTDDIKMAPKSFEYNTDGNLKTSDDFFTSQLNMCSLDKVEEAVFIATKGRKILIIGGIDPYSQVKELSDQSLLSNQYIGDSEGDSDSCNTHNWDTRSFGVASHRFNMGNFGDLLIYYDDVTQQWKQLSSIPFGPRHHHTAIVLNGLIYVIGGTRMEFTCPGKSIFEQSVWHFDPQTFQWTFECTLPESRRDFAAIVGSDSCAGCEHCADPRDSTKHSAPAPNGFFVIGGEGVNGVALDTVWFYDVVHKAWRQKASLNVGRYGMSAAIVNNAIWIAGGIIENKIGSFEGDGAAISAEACNLETAAGDYSLTSEGSAADVITDSAEYYSLKCSHSRRHSQDCAAELHNGDGYDGDCILSAECECADSSQNGDGCATEPQWIKSKHHLRIPRLFGKFAKISDNELYLVGGIGFNAENELTSLSSVDHFNFEDGKWHHSGDLIWARHGHDIAVVDDSIVVIGGVSTIKNCTLMQVESFCTTMRENRKDIIDLPYPLSGCAVVTLD